MSKKTKPRAKKKKSHDSKLEDDSKRAAEIAKQIALVPEDILDEDMMETFNESTEKQKTWLLEFLKTGNSDKAARKAYPDATKATAHQLAYRMRLKFRISVADLYRAAGITEASCITTTKKLLTAKVKTKTFQKGGEMIEVTEEDTYALDKGLSHAEKMLNIEPSKKVLLGEDADNPMASLTGAIISANKKIHDKRKSSKNKKQDKR